MTFFTSSYISQSIGGQQAMFAQNNYAAQQMSMMPPGMGMGGMGGMGPPPQMMVPPSPMTMSQQFRADQGGMMGESIAGGMASFGRNVAAPIAFGGLSLAGGMGMLGAAGRMFDPFGAAMSAGRMGFGMMGGGMMGVAGGAAMAGAAALPIYAGAKLAGAYGGAFTGGVQDQVALNQTLRSNFQFVGGPQGRGFTQGQMGSIGGMVQNELNQNLMTSAGEMNQLIGGGAQAGMFAGVRDVGQFAQKFRQMLDTLKAVQKELGGSLKDALQFVQESKQAGIYHQMDRSQFATQIREVTQMTGMSRGDALQLATQGAAISRQAGGLGAQGAFGAMRMARQMGSAITSGAIDESMLSEATGGLTGTAAINAFSTRMMEHTARFSRRPMGRFSLFSLADTEGRGGQMDQGMLQRFLAGDISVGEVSRTAHRNVGRMGRAQAINREGELRGSLMEQGGLAGQIGMMRLMLGDRAMNQGDDLSSLVMQRRFGMSRQESDIMMGLMRNQGSIAEQEAMDRAGSARGARRDELRRDRSLDAIAGRIGHEIEHGLGIHDVRQAGRRFVTKLSEGAERAMNQILGIYSDEMSNATRTALNRAATGQARQSDLLQLRALQQGMEAQGGGAGFDPFRQGMLSGLAGDRSVGERLESMGFDISGRGTGRQGRTFREFMGGGTASGEEMQSRTQDAIARINAARTGKVSAALQPQLEALMGNRQRTDRRFMMAEISARGRGGRGEDMFADLQRQGMAPEVAMAYMSLQGQSVPGMDRPLDMAGTTGEGPVTGGMIGRDLLRMTGVGGLLAAGVMGDGDLSMGNIFRSETLDALGITGMSSRDKALSFMASGGHAAQRAERVARTSRNFETRERASAAAAGLGGLDQAALDTITQDDKFRRLSLRMAGGGPGARDALAQLEIMAQAEPDQKRRAALQSLSVQARDQIGKNGRVGSEFMSAVMSPRFREELEAARREQGQIGMGFASAAIQLEDAAGGLSEKFRKISALFGAGQGPEAAAATSNLVKELAALPPEERARAMGELGRVQGEGSENIQAIMASVAHRAQVQRSLVGEGRRGRRQAIETAQQQFAGFGRGRDLDIEVGGRRVSGRRAERLVERFMQGGRLGGQETRGVLEALSVQAQEMGLSKEVQQQMTTAMQDVARARTPEDRKRAAENVMNLREQYGEDFQRLEKQQQEQAMAQLRNRDPLSAERNDLLKKIAANTQGAKDSGSGAESGKGGEES